MEEIDLNNALGAFLLTDGQFPNFAGNDQSAIYWVVLNYSTDLQLKLDTYLNVCCCC